MNPPPELHKSFSKTKGLMADLTQDQIKPFLFKWDVLTNKIVKKKLLFKNDAERYCLRRTRIMMTRKRFIRRNASLAWKDDEMITFDANQWVGSTEERQAKKLED